jgi:hypothetical protein
MAAETGDAFERAADTEYRMQTRRDRRAGKLSRARRSFHEKLSTLIFLSMAFAVHLYLVQRVTNWVIAHGVVIGLTFLALVGAWGDQRVADAELRERDRRS